MTPKEQKPREDKFLKAELHYAGCIDENCERIWCVDRRDRDIAYQSLLADARKLARQLEDALDLLLLNPAIENIESKHLTEFNERWNSK